MKCIQFNYLFFKSNKILILGHYEISFICIHFLLHFFPIWIFLDSIWMVK